MGCGDGLLIGLGNLPLRRVEFDAIAVKGNMAAGDHHRRHGVMQGKIGQGRCGKHADVDHFGSMSLDGGRTGLGDTGAAWT